MKRVLALLPLLAFSAQVSAETEVGLGVTSQISFDNIFLAGISSRVWFNDRFAVGGSYSISMNDDTGSEDKESTDTNRYALRALYAIVSEKRAKVYAGLEYSAAEREYDHSYTDGYRREVSDDSTGLSIVIGYEGYANAEQSASFYVETGYGDYERKFVTKETDVGSGYSERNRQKEDFNGGFIGVGINFYL